MRVRWSIHVVLLVCVLGLITYSWSLTSSLKDGPSLATLLDSMQELILAPCRYPHGIVLVMAIIYFSLSFWMC